MLYVKTAVKYRKLYILYVNFTLQVYVDKTNTINRQRSGSKCTQHLELKTRAVSYHHQSPHHYHLLSLSLSDKDSSIIILAKSDSFFNKAASIEAFAYNEQFINFISIQTISSLGMYEIIHTPDTLTR